MPEAITFQVTPFLVSVGINLAYSLIFDILISVGGYYVIYYVPGTSQSNLHDTKTKYGSRYQEIISICSSLKDNCDGIFALNLGHREYIDKIPSRLGRIGPTLLVSSYEIIVG